MKSRPLSILTVALITTVLVSSGAPLALAKGNEKKQEKHQEKSLKAELRASAKAEKKAEKEEEKEEREEKREEKKKEHEEKKEIKKNQRYCRGDWWNFTNWLWEAKALTYNPCDPATPPPVTPSPSPSPAPTPDTTAPVISDLKILRTTPRSITIEWKTNEPASSIMRLGTTTAYTREKRDGSRERNHRMTMGKLMPNSTYHFIVTAKDRAGNISTSTDMTATTKPLASTDTVAPIVSNIVVTVGTSTARIQWTTNELASGQIDFGTTTSYGRTSTSVTLSGSQDITLTNLEPSTLYNFRITAEDGSGNSLAAGNATFTTLTLPIVDATAPNISNVSATSIGSTTATVSWTTNEAATGKIYYGTTSPLVLGTAWSVSNALFSTNHTFLLSGLLASTTHYFVLESKDASTNATTSAQFNFTTTQ